MSKHKFNIRKLILNGESNKQIVNRLKCSSATVSYHRQKLIDEGFTSLKDYRNQLSLETRFNNINWCEVDNFVNKNQNIPIKCIRKKFKISEKMWKIALDKNLISRRSGMPLTDEEYFTSNNHHSGNTLKNRLFKMGWENKCSICGISEWQNQPLTIQIDHINGVSDDNRLENLRLLCPNCHSQTNTFSGRNCSNPKRDKMKYSEHHKTYKR